MYYKTHSLSSNSIPNSKYLIMTGGIVESAKTIIKEFHELYSLPENKNSIRETLYAVTARRRIFYKDIAAKNNIKIDYSFLENGQTAGSAFPLLDSLILTWHEEEKKALQNDLAFNVILHLLIESPQLSKGFSTLLILDPELLIEQIDPVFDAALELCPNQVFLNRREYWSAVVKYGRLLIGHIKYL